jgi:phosphoribosylamine-glycine ligase
MHILVVSREGDGLGVAQRLALEGNDVDLFIAEKRMRRAGRGIVNRVPQWRGNALARADLILADCIGLGRFEEVMRSSGKPFIGFCPTLDKIESDRLLGMQMFERAGMDVPETHPYASPAEAATVVREHGWGEGWVAKPSGNKDTAHTTVCRDEALWEHCLTKLPPCDGILQRLVSGVEVSTEGWFNGEDWIYPFNHTFEEKRFLAGDLGVNTGCMGNAVIGAGRGNRLTRRTVETLGPLLRMIGYRGPIDVNAIVNESGAYALEATSRMGFDAIEALIEGLEMPAGEFLMSVADGSARSMPLTDNVMIAVRVSIPPWPIRAPNQEDYGEPISGIDEGNLPHLFLADVSRGEGGAYQTAGGDNVLLKATATGRVERAKQSIKDGHTYRPDYTYDARRRVYRLLDRIAIRHKQYRNDIGTRVNADMERLKKWGWLS